MKKILSVLLLVCMLAALPVTSFAKTGDVIGYAKYTDISAYINHYPITSYNINGNTAVIAEDLANYGFNVVWNAYDRALYISKNDWATDITPYGTIYKYSSVAGQNSFAYLESDIRTYVNGWQVESFNIDGKTCIYIDSLAACGELVWAPEVRAIKLWLGGLPTAEYAPLPEAFVASTPAYVDYYPGTNVPTYSSITGRALDEKESESSYRYGADINEYYLYIETLTTQYGFEVFSNSATDYTISYHLKKDYAGDWDMVSLFYNVSSFSKDNVRVMP